MAFLSASTSTAVSSPWEAALAGAACSVWAGLAGAAGWPYVCACAPAASASRNADAAHGRTARCRVFIVSLLEEGPVPRWHARRRPSGSRRNHYNPAMARSTAAAAALYLLLAVLWAAPSSLSPARTAPDLGDAVHLGWVLSWNDHQVVRRPWALFEANGFHPYRHSLAFTDHLLPEALLVAPVYWATGNPVLVFNAALLSALALSALAMFLLVRHLTGSAAAALLAGVAYAFNSFTQHELARVHVLSVQWWPLAWLFLDRFVREGRPRDAALGAAALALQGLSGTYYLAYTLLLLPVWLPVLYLAQRRRPDARQIGRLLAALALAAIPVALMLVPYQIQFGGLGLEKGWPAGADLLAYVDPGPRNLVWGELHNSAVEPELPHFLGFLALVVIAMGLARTLAGRLPERARAGA